MYEIWLTTDSDPLDYRYLNFYLIERRETEDDAYACAKGWIDVGYFAIVHNSSENY